MGKCKRNFEKGFSVDEILVVCTNCFDEYAINQFISNNASNSSCSYCDPSGEHSCSLEFVLEHMLDCIRTEYEDPANGMMYISKEGGYPGSAYSVDEVLEDIGFEIENENLRDEIISSFVDTLWCIRDPYSLRQHEILFYGWEAFSKFVKNEARYLFMQTNPSTYDKHQHDEMNPVQILGELGKLSRELELINTIEQDSSIHRVRIVDCKETPYTARELGSPPTEYATMSNRMSPSGISMFYGAFDQQTAILETYEPETSNNKKAVCGVFHSTRNLHVLDLSQPFEVPSIFDSDSHHQRNPMIFLYQFVEDMAKPISRDDHSPVEYVPTQIVTEYFRHIFKTAEGEMLDGIVYPSSKHEGKSAVVLFADNTQCVDKSCIELEKAMLILDRVYEFDLPE